jgi:hypothetical protein
MFWLQQQQAASSKRARTLHKEPPLAARANANAP